MKADKALGVLGDDRANMNRESVREHDVGTPRWWVRSLIGLIGGCIHVAQRIQTGVTQ